jgi:hypothetical protein
MVSDQDGLPGALAKCLKQSRDVRRVQVILDLVKEHNIGLSESQKRPGIKIELLAAAPFVKRHATPVVVRQDELEDLLGRFLRATKIERRPKDFLHPPNQSIPLVAQIQAPNWLNRFKEETAFSRIRLGSVETLDETASKVAPDLPEEKISKPATVVGKIVRKVEFPL